MNMIRPAAEESPRQPPWPTRPVGAGRGQGSVLVGGWADGGERRGAVRRPRGAAGIGSGARRARCRRRGPGRGDRGPCRRSPAGAGAGPVAGAGRPGAAGAGERRPGARRDSPRRQLALPGERVGGRAAVRRPRRAAGRPPAPGDGGGGRLRAGAVLPRDPARGRRGRPGGHPAPAVGRGVRRRAGAGPDGGVGTPTCRSCGWWTAGS